MGGNIPREPRLCRILDT